MLWLVHHSRDALSSAEDSVEHVEVRGVYRGGSAMAVHSFDGATWCSIMTVLSLLRHLVPLV